jgi:hypothetical protein
MNGLNLAEMDASDMLDVLHYMFETDHTPPSEESARSKSAIRESIYPALYNTPYRYALPKDKNPSDGRFGVPDDIDLDTEIEPLPDPFSPKPKTVKPFTPASTFDSDAKLPFGSALDAPLK